MLRMDNVTLYDLMAEDLEVYVSKSKGFGFDIEINNEMGESLVDSRGVNPCAADSFADFCRSYLASYEKSLRRLAA